MVKLGLGPRQFASSIWALNLYTLLSVGIISSSTALKITKQVSIQHASPVLNTEEGTMEEARVSALAVLVSNLTKEMRLCRVERVL